MATSTTPREVFLALVNGVAEGHWADLPDLYAEQTDVTHPFDPLRHPALRTRDELREHFTPSDSSPPPKRKPVDITIHETLDPEVIVAEFAYQGTDPTTGRLITQPAVFVLRVRNGEIVESRDYFDHLSTAHLRGELDSLVAALKEFPPDRPDSSAA